MNLSSLVRSNSARIVVGGLVLMALLAMSLPALRLERGAGLLLPFAPSPQGGVGTLADRADWFIWLFRGLLAVAIVALPLYIVINLFSPEGRRRLLADLILFAVIWAAASYLADHPLTGGYPVIGCVATHHLDLAAQLPVGAVVRFRVVTRFAEVG